MTHFTDVASMQAALSRGESLSVVHYACQSFYEAKDHPPEIAAIAVYDLHANEVLAFSRSDAPPGVEGSDRELDLLRRFYDDLSGRLDTHILHWNMNRPEYGFRAIETRYRHLTSESPKVSAPHAISDVDTLIARRFGNGYAPHGRLESTARLNGLDMRSFLSGRAEAERFKSGDWTALTRSTASKAKIIGELFMLLAKGSLVTADSAGQVPFGPTSLDAVTTVLQIGERFILVQRSLAKHPHGKDPLTFNNEWDDQYVYRALLAMFFDDIRDEEFGPSYAGKNSRIDFLLPEYGLAIELKHTRSGLTDGELGEQLVTDTARYAPHPSVRHLVCQVFDYAGHIRNPRALEKDLKKKHSSSELAVTVRIYDR